VDAGTDQEAIGPCQALAALASLLPAAVGRRPVVAIDGADGRAVARGRAHECACRRGVA
jgi:hypothetical protein